MNVQEGQVPVVRRKIDPGNCNAINGFDINIAGPFRNLTHREFCVTCRLETYHIESSV